MIKFHEVTWYSKLGATLFIFLVLPVLSFYIGMRYEEVKSLSYSDVEFKTIQKVESAKGGPIKTEGLRIPFDFNKIYSNKNRQLNDVLTPYGKLTFVLDDNHSRNQGYYVFLDGKQIGDKNDEVGGQDYKYQIFSPNKQFYSFVSRGQSGCCAFNMGIDIVDLENRKFIPIRNPENYNIFTPDYRVEIMYYIESIKWKDNNELLITGFFVATMPKEGREGSEPEGYRISPIKVWQYNILTNAYSIIQELKETT